MATLAGLSVALYVAWCRALHVALYVVLYSTENKNVLAQANPLPLKQFCFLCGTHKNTFLRNILEFKQITIMALDLLKAAYIHAAICTPGLTPAIPPIAANEKKCGLPHSRLP